ncbi:glycosyltransferase family 2 protein [Thermoactinospora rubra]|uniref:glycosyltransferase family 2 protein n=1 Tax=Thermoactinospora rubra TaxID=1088767 RepID=UPI000A10089F|nr:glycosyltransferase [Thermoactinospora rubra]
MGLARPDVSVIVAVYNTMPYLRECLSSLAGQSIGAGRMEIVAVDDGSTDGSAEELDRFAERHPGAVRVVHQANSGGPAAPSNLGLELATGRYVYFVGADDHLADEALERLVAAADAYGSDVVLGKMIGVNGRHIPQQIYAASRTDTHLFEWPMPLALSNAKLFRRELIDAHRLRFPEHMPLYSDQPFTMAALFHARRVSVLADYTFYYAVGRDDGSNITKSATPLEQLRATEHIFEFAAGLIPPGQDRDLVLRRHFSWELARHLRPDNFLGYDRLTQEQVCRTIARLAEAYLTDNLRAQLTRLHRYRLTLAARGEIDTLCQALKATEPPPVLVRDGLPYTCLPGHEYLPGDCTLLSGDLTRRIADGLRVTSMRWRGQVLELAGETGLRGEATVSVRLAPLSDENKPVTGRPDSQPASAFRFELPLPFRPGRYAVRLSTEIAGVPYDFGVPAVDLLPRLRVRRGLRKWLMRTKANSRGHLMLTVARDPKPRAGVLGRLMGRSGAR